MLDDISFLVEETFKQVEMQALCGEHNKILMNEDNKNSVPLEVPGLFYHLQQNAATFVIRVLPSQNLREDYKLITASPEEYPTLRLIGDDGFDLSRLKFFECDSSMHAKIIKHQLGNKRFPVEEENIFNLSDPGDSWWLKDNGDEFTIEFKLSHMQGESGLVKLGPLGDDRDVMELFRKLNGYFALLFPLQYFSSAHGQMVMSTSDPKNKMFHGIKELFLYGETDHSFWEKLRELEVNTRDEKFLKSLQKANFFLMELAAIRRFWMVIQEDL